MYEPYKYKLLRSRKGGHTFLDTYELHKEEIARYAREAGWGETYKTENDRCVRNKLAPHLKNSERKTMSEYTLEDFQTAMKEIKAEGKGKAGESYVPYEDGTLAHFEFLYRAIVAVAAKHFECIDYFEADHYTTVKIVGEKQNGSESEKFARIRKSLRVEEEVACWNYILKKFADDPVKPGLLLMFLGPMRNGEVAGSNFEYIRTSKELSEDRSFDYLLISQSVISGTSQEQASGKSDNADREIPLPTLIACLLRTLQRYRSWLWEQEHPGQTIDSGCLPIVCGASSVEKRCSSDVISQAARKMFQEIGIIDSDLVQVKELLDDDESYSEIIGDEEFRMIEKDPTAYVLRRNAATHLQILGVPETGIRYLVGHAIDSPYERRSDWANENRLYELKKLMDQRPIVNPLTEAAPIELLPSGSKMENDVFDSGRPVRFRIPVEKLQEFETAFHAKEPGRPARVRITAHLSEGSISVDGRSYPKPVAQSENRTISCTNQYRDSYRRAIQKNLLVEIQEVIREMEEKIGIHAN